MMMDRMWWGLLAAAFGMLSIVSAVACCVPAQKAIALVCPVRTGPALERFQNVPVLSPFADGSNWWLVEPLSYSTTATATGATCNVIIPKGFVTDFASTPRFLWALFPSWGRYGRAAVLHDFLYRRPGGLTRKEADLFLLTAMRDDGVRSLTAAVVYTGVRLGGWMAWDEHREQKEETPEVPAGFEVAPCESWNQVKQRIQHGDYKTPKCD